MQSLRVGWDWHLLRKTQGSGSCGEHSVAGEQTVTAETSMNIRTLAMAWAAVLAVPPAYAGNVDPAAIIAAHNKWRAEAGVTGPLTYSPVLAQAAQTWADTLKSTNNCQMRHSTADGRYGENLYWGSAVQRSDGRTAVQKVTPEHVVYLWGREKAHYDPKRNSCAPGKVCGHYTQVVWSTTTEVGCGMSVCEDTKQQVWVCRYAPAGNWVGKKPF
jgi:pathogenesis-related protein 1